MAQDGNDDDDYDLGLEEVDSATPSAGPSVSQTPSAAGKRSREDSQGLETTGKRSKSEARADDGAGEDDDDDENIDLEDI